MLAPTATDAKGVAGKVTLTLTGTTATLTLDPQFAATASYPVTIDPTVNWFTYGAYTTLGYDHLAPPSELTNVAGDPTTPNPSSSTYTYGQARNRTQRVQGPASNSVTTTYSYDKAEQAAQYELRQLHGERQRQTDGAGERQLHLRPGQSAHELHDCGYTPRSPSYTCNGDGLRASKIGGASTTTSYLYDLAAGLPALLGDGTRKYVWGATGLAHAVDRAGNVEAYHQDGLGTIRFPQIRAELARTIGSGTGRPRHVTLRPGTRGRLSGTRRTARGGRYGRRRRCAPP